MGVCGLCAEIHLTVVSHSSIFTPDVQERLGNPAPSFFVFFLPPFPSLTNNYSVGYLTGVMELEEDVSLKD